MAELLNNGLAAHYRFHSAAPSAAPVQVTNRMLPKQNEQQYGGAFYE
jgi:hypothetical protein